LFSEQGVPYPHFISTAHNMDHEDSFLRHAARRVSVHGYERIVSVSDAVREYAIKDLGASPRRVMKIDGMRFLDAPPRAPVPFHDPPRFVTVARLVPQKGIETALRALANVPPPWQYTILGGGVLERDLKELAESLGIASRVRFMGASLRSSEVMQASDVFLFPSRWEGLGSAVIEAASIGLPVLTSDLPALQSVFPESSRLPVDDPDAWTKAIRVLLRAPDRAQASAQRLMPDLRLRFHPDTIVRQYAEVYRELVGGI
jgi:glycosyltransferase involved in cell wall biosynthesis